MRNIPLGGQSSNAKKSSSYTSSSTRKNNADQQILEESSHRTLLQSHKRQLSQQRLNLSSNDEEEDDHVPQRNKRQSYSIGNRKSSSLSADLSLDRRTSRNSSCGSTSDDDSDPDQINSQTQKRRQSTGSTKSTQCSAFRGRNPIIDKRKKTSKQQRLPATDLTSDEDSDPDQVFSQTQKRQSTSSRSTPRNASRGRLSAGKRSEPAKQPAASSY